MDVYIQVGQGETNNDAKQNENEQAQICVTRWFEEQKKQARNQPKQTSRKATTRQKKKQAAE